MSTKNIYNSATGQTGYQVPGSSLPAGWQWGTPPATPPTVSNPAPLPALPSTKKTLTPEPTPAGKSLPTSIPNNTSRLLTFSNALNTAVDIARRKKLDFQASYLNEGVAPGTRRASDFSGLLSGLNNTDQNFIEPLVKTAVSAAENDYNDLTTIATKAAESGAPQSIVNEILNATSPGHALTIATPFLATSEKTSDTADIKDIAISATKGGAPADMVNKILDAPDLGTALTLAIPYTQSRNEPTPDNQKKVYSGNLITSGSEIGQGATILNNSRGPDNYVDPTVYLNMYNEWIHQGGLPQDFTKYYPPKTYVNPENAWLPANLRSATGSYSPPDDDSVDNPFD